MPFKLKLADNQKIPISASREGHEVAPWVVNLRSSSVNPDELAYQIRTRSAGVRYRAWPGFTWKAVYQASKFLTVFTRY